MPSQADERALLEALTGAPVLRKLGRARIFELADGRHVYFEVRTLKNRDRGHYYIAVRPLIHRFYVEHPDAIYLLFLPDERRLLRVPAVDLLAYLETCAKDRVDRFNLPIFIRDDRLVAKGSLAAEVDWTRYVEPLSAELQSLLGPFASASADETDVEELDFREQALRATPPARKPKGNAEPVSTLQAVTVFQRSVAVAAWVLARAAGRCELCRAPAPFSTSEGRPFLEVHHLIRLADGGPDTVKNVAALCPNCHRCLHYGADGVALTGQLQRELGIRERPGRT